MIVTLTGPDGLTYSIRIDPGETQVTAESWLAAHAAGSEHVRLTGFGAELAELARRHFAAEAARWRAFATAQRAVWRREGLEQILAQTAEREAREAAALAELPALMAEHGALHSRWGTVHHASERCSALRSAMRYKAANMRAGDGGRPLCRWCARATGASLLDGLSPSALADIADALRSGDGESEAPL